MAILRKPYADCGIPDENRCRRTDVKKGWRCSKPKTEGSSYCQHHRDLFRKNQQRKKERDFLLRNSRRLLPHTPMAFVGITKRSLGIRRKKDESCLQQVLLIPSEIYELKGLNGVLNMETWQSCLAPQDRKMLQRYLPCLQGVTSIEKQVLEPLLNGSNLFFGNPALEWGSSVCRAEREPKNIIKKEASLQSAKKMYYDFLKTYHLHSIDVLEKLEDMYSSCHATLEDVEALHLEFMEKLNTWRGSKTGFTQQSDS